jgi:hypothetical protein
MKKELKTNMLKSRSVLAIALVVVIGFSMTACDVDGGGGGGGGGGGYLGSSLTLSGPVYTQDVNIEAIMSGSGDMFKYTPYKGPPSVFTSNVGGSGSISNGKMSFSVGAPDPSFLEPFERNDLAIMGDYDIYRDASVSPSNVNGVSLDLTDYASIDLSRMNMIVNTSTGSRTVEMVNYIYYDRDCTVTATGGKATDSSSGVSVTITFPNLNIKFKKGWNTLYIKITSSSTTGSVVINQSDPSSCKWVIDEY